MAIRCNRYAKSTNARCKNTTTRPDGWCGTCQGIAHDNAAGAARAAELGDDIEPVAGAAVPAKLASDVLFEQAAAAMEAAQGRMCLALEKRVADAVRERFPDAHRVVLDASNEGNLVDATVYTGAEPEQATIIDYDPSDPLYNRLDDSLRTLLELGWDGQVDGIDEHHIVFDDVDADFERVRPLVSQPGSNLSRTVYQIEVLHHTDDETSLDPNVNTIGYWIGEGHASGVISTVSTIEVGDDDMGRLLTAQGSDPEFLLGYADY